jgi:hypothetical protein
MIVPRMLIAQMRAAVYVLKRKADPAKSAQFLMIGTVEDPRR